MSDERVVGKETLELLLEQADSTMDVATSKASYFGSHSTDQWYLEAIGLYLGVIARVLVEVTDER